MDKLSQQLDKAAKIVEDQVDKEIEKLDKLNEDDYEVLREKRLAALKKLNNQKNEWRLQGHGEYQELADEKDIFQAYKKSKNVVCHFFRNETFRCKIVDKHLTKLAQKHIETRFCKVNAERCPFLVERLQIKVIPTIAIIHNEKVCDYIVGFTDLGNHDEFSTEMMEWRLAQSKVINYSGDLTTPPDQQDPHKKKISILGKKEKTIRGGDDDSSDDDLDNDW